MATIISSFYVLIQILCKAKEDVPRVRWFSTFLQAPRYLSALEFMVKVMYPLLMPVATEFISI